MDIGLLLIRVVLGGTMAAHGAQKLLGLFGGGGLAGTGAFLESLGFRPGRRHAEMAGVAEIACGGLLAAGALTPFAAAGFIGLMIVAAVTVNHRSFFITQGGFEYNLVLGAVAAGIAFTGPGFVSVDRLLDLDMRGVGWGALAILIGVAAAAAQLATRNAEIDSADVDLRDEPEPLPAPDRAPRTTGATSDSAV